MKIVAMFPGATSASQPLTTKEALGLREFFEDSEHELVLISSDEEIDDHIEDMAVFISSPFLPGYIDEDRIKKANELKLSITAGVGSDHVDIDAAADNKILVAEVAKSNVISVAEQNVMEVLLLIKNYEEGHRQAEEGEWDLPKVGSRAKELYEKTVGIFGLGSIGLLTAERLKPFDAKLLYHDPKRNEDAEEELGMKYVEFDELIETSDVIIIQSPLTKKTRDKFNKEIINKMKDDVVVVNCARGEIVNADDIAEAVKSKKIRYGGDVWYPQPAPADHPWRELKQTGLTIHYSGMTLETQVRIEEGIKEILKAFLEGTNIRKDYLIVDEDSELSQSYQ